MATTLALVKSWLKLASPADDEILTECVAAANLLGIRYQSGVAPPELSLGLTMLAARLYRRRLSPEGVQTVTGDAGVSTLTIARTDPDIARLLRIDSYTIPQVG